MRVILISKTTLTQDAFHLFDELGFIDEIESETDILHEFAGRNCYQSFHKPNPATRSNADYLANIIDSAHESVLEHGNFTFFVDGVSRNLLLELERHRMLSFSVLSTRYVDPDRMANIPHPNTPQASYEAILNLSPKIREVAEKIYSDCRSSGMNVKQSREVARQVLPGSTETKMVVTGNVRAWKHVIRMRNAEGADVEIQEFAKKILENLKRECPNSVQDL